jgi:type IV pilus assembly protein PilA
MTGRTPRSRGFTLIELMIVVGIISILASVAIPEFTRLTLRAKAAERHEVMQRIKKAVADVFVQQGHIPGGLIMPGAFEPAIPLTMAKRMPNWKAPGWVDIFRSTEEIEGALYYSYFFRADDTVSPPTLEIWSMGDLDGDGLPSTKYLRYQRVNGVYQTDESDTTCTWVCPPLGGEDMFTF